MPLRCPVEPIQAQIPLFPHKRQRWLLVVRANPELDITDLVRVAFQRWLPLLGPGKISEPEIVEDNADDDADGVVATAPDELLLPEEPRRFAFVDFDYIGDATEARWPSFARRRRERIDPLCPAPPLTLFPLAVLQPVGDVDEIDPLPPFQAFPPLVGFNPNLPPPSEWWKQPELWAVGAVVGALLVLRFSNRR